MEIVTISSYVIMYDSTKRFLRSIGAQQCPRGGCCATCQFFEFATVLKKTPPFVEP